MQAFALLAVLLELLTVYQGRVTVYARHLRRHPHGALRHAVELTGQLHEGAELAGVPLWALAALVHDESAFNHEAVSPCGAVGAAQLLPASPWGRGFREEVRAYELMGIDAREHLNILWGAYALRDALTACGGNLVMAYGFYRTGHCRSGPRGQHTARLAEWIRSRMHEGGAAYEVVRF